MLFRPVLSTIGTPSDKLAKFLVIKLSSITFNEFTVKDSFVFAFDSFVDVIEGINKSEFEKLLSLTTQESYFIFNDILYKQKDGVAMASPLRPTMANAFLSIYELKGLLENSEL